MLSDMKRDCVNSARKLGDYQSIDLTTLMNGYCAAIDAVNKSAMDMFIAAIILRVWYVIDRIFKKSTGLGLDREDIFMWVVEAINYACKYRAWQNPDKHVTAQACLMQCINTIRLQHYYEYNLDKNRANYNTVSVETVFAGDENENTILDTLVDEQAEHDRRYDEGANVASSIVQSYINRNKVIEAIILDTIAFNDTERHIKVVNREVDEETGETVKKTDYFVEFWAHRLIKILSSLPEDYADYFSSKYVIKQEIFDAALEKIKTSNNQKLYRYLNKCLADCRASMSIGG